MKTHQQISSKTIRRAALLLLLLILLAGGVLPTLAQAGYTIPWYSIGSLCDQASGGGYTLICSMGDVAGTTMTGGSYSLTGGYVAGVPPSYQVMLPLIRR